MCTSFFVSFVCCGACTRASTMGGFALVDITPCFVCVMCTLMVSVACGKYYGSLEYVRPGHMYKFPALIALRQVCFVGNPADAYRYLTSDAIFGRSNAL